MSNDSGHKLTYRGIELPIAVESFIASSSIVISRAFLQGIDAALDAREALVNELDARDQALNQGYEKLAKSKYEYFRDEIGPENPDNYYRRIDSDDHVTTVYGKGAIRSQVNASARNVRTYYTLTPEHLVPDWAKVD